MGLEFEGSFRHLMTVYLGVAWFPIAWTTLELPRGVTISSFTLNSGGYFDRGFLIRTKPADNRHDPRLSQIQHSPNIRCGWTGSRVIFLRLFSGNKVTAQHLEHQHRFVQSEFRSADTVNGFVNADFTHESSKFISGH